MRTSEEVPEILIDGIGSIALLGGLVRADLIKLLPNPDDQDKPLPKTSYRLIVSPQGFLQMTNAMNALVEKLKDSGVIQTRERENQGSENEDRDFDKKRKKEN